MAKKYRYTDPPRYKTIIQYEAKHKNSYRKLLASMQKALEVKLNALINAKSNKS